MRAKTDFLDVLILILALFLIWAVLTDDRADASTPEIDLKIIGMIESSGNPLAVNKKEGSYGLYQIRKVALDDYNQRNKLKFRHSEMLDSEKAEKVARWMFEKRIPQMLRAYGKPVTKKNIIWAYNCGIGCVIRDRLPKTTREYLIKYGRMSNEAI